MVVDPYKAYKPSNTPGTSSPGDDSGEVGSRVTHGAGSGEKIGLLPPPSGKGSDANVPAEESVGHNGAKIEAQGTDAVIVHATDDTVAKGNAKQLATTSARSAGRLVLSPIKGLLVDVPLAATEGMRALPRLYGDRGYEREAITDWKSGSMVAAKSFAAGVNEGMTDIFRLTYTRKKREGAKGVAKGLSMGLMNFAMKTGSGALGLVAYPCRGVYMSVHSALHTKTKKVVEQAKLDEGEWLRSKISEDKASESEIVRSFTLGGASR